MDTIYEMKKEMFRRKYSIRTIKTYVFCVKKFIKWFPKELEKANKHDVRKFLQYLCGKNMSASTLNLYLQSIKFALEEVTGKPKFWVSLPYSKVEKKLPEVLSKEEVIKIFNAIENKKHLLLVRLMYSAGLRVSETVHLKVRDLELDRNFGWVRKGKGNKDRLFIIARKLKPELEERIRDEKLDSTSWIFSGRNSHFTTRSVQEIIKKAIKKEGIKRKIHPHTLRHSFATHLIEHGYSVSEVQPLMGHNSPNTTMMYVHMASPKMINVKSPYDEL